MLTQIYNLEELTESADLLESGPPSWLQFLAFAIMIGLLVGAAWLGRDMKQTFHQHGKHYVNSGAK